jgi:hypothetical protein
MTSHRDEFKTKKYLIGSLVTHITLVIFLFFQNKIKTLFWNGDTPQVVSEIIRVDVVGLPKLTLKELEELKDTLSTSQKNSVNTAPINDELERAKVDSAESNVSDSNESINSETSGMDLIKRLSNQSGIKHKNNKHLKAKNLGRKSVGSRKLKNLLLEGNQISKGSSVKGRYQGDVAQFDQYVLTLPHLIRPFWKLPSFLKQGDFQARVVVYINSEGVVVHQRFISKSGNEDFDSRALKSISESQPFPAPGPEIKDRLLSEGVILGFPL